MQVYLMLKVKNVEAAKVYTELINEGYTGVKTEYKAKIKKQEQ